jgi:hypothetical protein
MTEPQWLLFSAWIFGLTAVGVLLWLLLPSSAYRKAKEYAKQKDDAKISRWKSYRSVKRFVTPRKIVMNAVQEPSFTIVDLEKLNELLGKLDQPPAVPIQVEVGTQFDENTMVGIESECDSDRKMNYVLKAHSFGVEWKGDVLKKASVCRCTSDRLMMLELSRMASKDDRSNEAISAILDHKNELLPDFMLDSSWLQGFIDTKIEEKQVSHLFEALKDLHPENDFVIYSPLVGKQYNNDTMIALGSLPGHRCTVQEVIHPGLLRNSDKSWRIRALVRIKNPSRNEIER